MKVRIRRFDGQKEWWQDYEVEAKPFTTVLDILNYIRENLDHTLAYRHSCQMGSCGSCGVVINGKPALACQTRVGELKTDTLRIEPLYNYRVIRDLVVDLTDFVNKHRSVKPWMIRKNPQELEEAPSEFKVTPQQNLTFIQFDYCIMCGVCLAACPTVAIDPLFLGPQALAQAYRYIADPRDEGLEDRIDVLDDSHGVWRCHFAGACSYVCPKGVDPAKAIQYLKKEILKFRLLGKKKKAVPPAEIVQKEPPPNAPKPPPFDFKFEGGVE
ncbi:MAG: succinate dehydrogenase/fumarate reductase iron-sulfur subunit [Nitrososphaeria archaeon]|jgi:succinate dehydrogenase / fumarate reductase iron-sulfur subunit